MVTPQKTSARDPTFKVRKDPPIVPTPPAPTPDTRDWMTRNEASDMLSCSHQTLSNYERKGDLHPQFAYRPDGRGTEHRVIVYSPHELKKLAIKLRRHVLQPRDPGEMAARAFELFREGKSMEDVVVELRMQPEHVEALYAKRLDMGGADLVISPTAKEEFTKMVGSFESVAELLERVSKLKSRERGAEPGSQLPVS